MGAKVTGFVTKVLAIAVGTLALRSVADTAATGICARGIKNPKKIPRPTPSATPLLLKYHN